MKKKKWNRVLAVLLMMVMSISLLSGCGGKSTEKEDAETITVYLWSTNLYEKYAPYIQEQLPDINVEFVVGNNDLDFYKFLKENGGLPDKQGFDKDGSRKPVKSRLCRQQADGAFIKNEYEDGKRRILRFASFSIGLSALP